MSQEMKAKIAPTIKALCKKYNVKATLAVSNHSTLVLKVKQGAIDFIGNYNSVMRRSPYGDRATSQVMTTITPNPYWFHEHFDGEAKAFLTEAFAALKGPDYFDKSDVMSDYFHCSHYVEVKVGSWDSPYTLLK